MTFFGQSRLLLTAGLMLLPSMRCHAEEALAAAPFQQAIGIVDLYFKAPLISHQLKESTAWDHHDSLSADEISELRPVVWDRFRKSRLKGKEATESYNERRLEIGDDVLRFTIRKPKNHSSNKALPLTISLHGGGEASRKANDLQWQAQQMRYPKVSGIYVCPRAPRDTWNQWHSDNIYPMISKLIEEITLRENVDPNRIYLTGFSAGGYGAFCIGSKMADRFAAVAAAAGSPTPDHSPAENWHNTPLRFEVGEKDVAYNRVTLCRAYQESLTNLAKKSSKAYSFNFIEHAGHGHQIDDRMSITWLAKHRRDARPKSVVWKPTDNFIQQFYWLANEEPRSGQQIKATINENCIQLQTTDVNRLKLRLDDTLVNLDEPISVHANGMKIFEGMVSRGLQCLVQTLEERGDAQMMFCSEIDLYIP